MTKKCWPWKHDWENKSISGVYYPSFLDQCSICGWWKQWGLVADGSYARMYPPKTFITITNRKTQEEILVFQDKLQETLEKLNVKKRRWSRDD